MENDLLRVETIEDGERIILVPVGELDLSTSPLLIDRCADAVNDRPAGIDMDLSGVTYADSVGLSVFVTAHFQCLDAGITLRFLNPDRFIGKLLEMTSLDGVLQIAKTDALVCS